MNRNFQLTGLLCVVAFLLTSSSVRASLIMDVYTGGTFSNLTAVDNAIAGGSPIATDIVSFVDHYDGSGGTGHFPNNLPFPGGVSNNFGVHVTGSIIIQTGGNYTFGTNNDDGVRLRIDGNDVIVDDNLHGPADFFGTVNLSAGVHTLDLTFFEFGGGATLELFAQAGSHTSYNGGFQLVGDTANGGLATTTTTTVIPEPASLTLLGIGAAGMAYGAIRRRRKQAA